MAKTKYPDFKETISTYIRSIKLIHRSCPKLYLSMIFSDFLQEVIPYITLYFSTSILDELAGSQRPEILKQQIFLMLLVELLVSVINACLQKTKKVQIGVFHLMRRRLYTEKMFSLDFADMDKQETADLYAQITQNEMNMGWGLYRVVQDTDELLQSFFQIGGAILLSVRLFTSQVSRLAGMLVWLNHPIFIFFFLGFIGWIMKFRADTANRIDEKRSFMAEENREANRLATYYGFKVCKPERALDIRLYEQDKLSEHYHKKVDVVWGMDSSFGKWLVKKGGVLVGVSNGMQSLFSGLVYAFVGLKALGGAFGIGSVMRYVGAMTALQKGLARFYKGVGQLRINMVYLKDSFTFLDIPNAMYQGSIPTEKRNDREYEVEFKNVSFKYPGSDFWALCHVNIKFQVGKKLAVVGENGSGKTTFIKLLCRLYDPSEGQILLNGIDIRKYNYEEYLDIFSVVFQDFQLLSRSIGENVAGSEEFDAGLAEKCLADVGFAERLQTMPEGVKTMLYKDSGENGVILSGGEAQKIAIARALYKDAPFIILDEPTAALDPIAEAEIYERFNEIVGDRTAVYISHRLSSCKFCDEILVFDGGNIIQKGTHRELLKNQAGKYYELWNAQAQYYMVNE